jgi:hypothetical protein
MANFSQSSTARIASIASLSAISDVLDLSPPEILSPIAADYWQGYISQKSPEEWTPAALGMLTRLVRLAAMYDTEFERLETESPIAHRASGAPFRSPRWDVCNEILTKIGIVESYLGLQARTDSAAARSARVVNLAIASDEDGLLT